MVYLFLEFGVDIGINVFNGLIFFYSVVVCGVVEVIDYLFYYGVNLSVVDDIGFIVLYYVIFNINLSYFE